MKHAEAAKLKKQVKQLAQTLLENELVFTAAESCTGGWLAKCCTDIAGSSAWFDRGFITYSNAAKQDMLSVTALSLNNYGAVSEQVATEMAQGALSHSQANIAVAITGIAGPEGGSDEKPVGTVFISWAQNSHVETLQYQFEGDREQVRYQSVMAAMAGIIKNARA